jgi:flagellar hook-associated protein 2
MGTITMSGFNKIDWSAILQAVMQQERQPLTTMETQKTALTAKSSAFSTLATKLGALESAAADLTSASGFAGRKVTSTDSSIVSASASSTAMIGAYDVVVNSVARAQVTTLGSSSPTTAPIGDRDQTVVATGGTLTFLDAGGQPILDNNGNPAGVVTLADGSYTLEQVAAAINSTEGVPARATIVQANGNYQIVLTGTGTGVASAFTLANNLTGGVSWGQATPMAATDADVDINNVKVTSSSNVIEDAIAGVSLTLLRNSQGAPVTVGVTADDSATKTKVEAFIKAFNDIVSFADAQSASARNGEKGSIGNDPMLRGLRNTLSEVLNREYNVGGAFSHLSLIGIEFTRTGQLSMNSSLFDDAMRTSQDGVTRLLAGATGVTGAFSSIKAAISDYTSAGGLVPDAKSRMDEQVKALESRMSAMEDRLAIRQAALQAEYAAADEMISKLNSQGSSLASMISSYSAF